MIDNIFIYEWNTICKVYHECDDMSLSIVELEIDKQAFKKCTKMHWCSNGLVGNELNIC